MTYKLFNIRTVVLLAFMLTATGLWAMDTDDEDDSPNGTSAATQDAGAKPAAAAKTAQAQPSAAASAPSPTNPAAPILQLQLQNQFVPSSWDGSGYSNVFLFQPVIPMSVFGNPYIMRITVPFVSTPDPFNPLLSSANDFGDTTMITWKMNTIKDGFWAGDLGFGASLVAPTGADPRTGQGKWQLGPSMVYINTLKPKIEWGILASQTWSISGDNSRDSVSQLQFQPIFTYNLKNKWYLSTGDHIWTRDWKAKTWDLPLSFGPGKVFKMGKLPVNAYLIPYYNIGDKVSDKWGIKFNLAIMFDGGFSVK